MLNVAFAEDHHGVAIGHSDCAACQGGCAQPGVSDEQENEYPQAHWLTIHRRNVLLQNGEGWLGSQKSRRILNEYLNPVSKSKAAIEAALEQSLSPFSAAK
jgi:hypothetical protein